MGIPTSDAAVVSRKEYARLVASDAAFTAMRSALTAQLADKTAITKAEIRQILAAAAANSQEHTP